MGDNDRESEAPFNMAIATLKRLDDILTKITTLSYIYPQDSPVKQKAYISLIKQFYINAAPLIGESEDEEIKKIKTALLEFQIERKTNIKSGVQRCNFQVSGKKEEELDQMLITLQIKLKKFFMPRGKDPSQAVHFK